MSPVSHESDVALARRIAIAAGDHLQRLRGRGAPDGQALGALADHEANALILSMLRDARPDDAFLSEESPPDPARLLRHRVWIIDPLDGTREYGDVAGFRPDWAVHVALTEGGLPTACAVALPGLGLTFDTAQVPVPPAASPGARLRIVVSRSRAPSVAQAVARELDAELVPMGSAGAKAMAVVRGEADAYLHAGGMYEWDTCAPVGVALAAGLHASRIDGSACLYNRADHTMPDLLVCRPALAGAMLAAIRHA